MSTLLISVVVNRRWVFCKLDFNSEGWLAGNFTPHKASVIAADDQGKRRLVVWNGYQLHEDVGERLGLNKKMSRRDWKTLKEWRHESKPNVDSLKRRIQYGCLGDECPNEYVMPQDWDALGDLSSRKRQKIMSALPASLTSASLTLLSLAISLFASTLSTQVSFASIPSPSRKHASAASNKTSLVPRSAIPSSSTSIEFRRLKKGCRQRR